MTEFVLVALGATIGANTALVAVWWFQPRRFNTATHNALHTHPQRQLAAPPRRAPAVRTTHPVGARPHRPAHTSPTGILGDLAATHPELAERLRVRYREAMATRGTH